MCLCVCWGVRVYLRLYSHSENGPVSLADAWLFQFQKNQHDLTGYFETGERAQHV